MPYFVEENQRLAAGNLKGWCLGIASTATHRVEDLRFSDGATPLPTRRWAVRYALRSVVYWTVALVNADPR